MLLTQHDTSEMELVTYYVLLLLYEIGEHSSFFRVYSRPREFPPRTSVIDTRWSVSRLLGGTGLQRRSECPNHRRRRGETFCIWRVFECLHDRYHVARAQLMKGQTVNSLFCITTTALNCLFLVGFYHIYPCDMLPCNLVTRKLFA